MGKQPIKELDAMNEKLNPTELRPIKDIVKLLPQFNDGPVHHSTIWRWCRKGISGIKLQHRRVGRRICTSLEYTDQFFDKLARRDEERLAIQEEYLRIHPSPSSKRRDREITDAEHTLKSEGF